MIFEYHKVAFLAVSLLADTDVIPLKIQWQGGGPTTALLVIYNSTKKQLDVAEFTDGRVSKRFTLSPEYWGNGCIVPATVSLFKLTDQEINSLWEQKVISDHHSTLLRNILRMKLINEAVESFFKKVLRIAKKGSVPSYESCRQIWHILTEECRKNAVWCVRHQEGALDDFMHKCALQLNPISQRETTSDTCMCQRIHQLEQQFAEMEEKNHKFEQTISILVNSQSLPANAVSLSAPGQPSFMPSPPSSRTAMAVSQPAPHNGIHYVGGNAVTLAMSEKDYSVAFAHGCNCFCTMGGGIALEVKQRLPQLYAADCATANGDHRKLGTFSSAVFDWGVGYNLYMLYSPYDKNDMLDWGAVERSLAAMFRDVEHRGIKVVVMPKICCGIARGDLSVEEAWRRVVRLLDQVCPADIRLIVVEYDPNSAPQPPSEFREEIQSAAPTTWNSSSQAVAPSSREDLRSTGAGRKWGFGV